MKSTKQGWTIEQYSHDTGIGRTTIYELIKGGDIAVVKIGSRTIVTTPPSALFDLARDNNLNRRRADYDPA